MNYENLKRYGFNDRFENDAKEYERLIPARVTQQHTNLYKIITEQGEISAAVSGKLMYTAQDSLDFPAVGDWVMADIADSNSNSAVIRGILARKSVFVRKAAGTSNTVQIVAANIDMVFICMSLNEDFNLRRLERYLVIAWDSMATPIIVLTKADLCGDLSDKLLEVESVSVGTDVIVCSSMYENGFESVKSYIKEGRTIAFLGSSGVGKSTLINRLLGQDVLKTKEIREDDGMGRHTTTHRELILLPGGGVVIDTPGMREMQISTGNLRKAFEDIEDIAQNCRFKDCSHIYEPGCAVKAAIETGELDEKRFASYQKLLRETAYSGMNSRQLENEKINRMFGSKAEMKRAKKDAKQKNER